MHFVNCCIWDIESSRNFWHIKYAPLSDWISQVKDKKVWTVWFYKVKDILLMGQTRTPLEVCSRKMSYSFSEKFGDIPTQEKQIPKLWGWTIPSDVPILLITWVLSFSFLSFFFFLNLQEHFKFEVIIFRNTTGEKQESKNSKNKSNLPLGIITKGHKYFRECYSVSAMALHGVVEKKK